MTSRLLTTPVCRRRVLRIPGPRRRDASLVCRFLVHRGTDGRECVAAVPAVRHTHGRIHPPRDGKALREQVCTQAVVGN